MADQRPRTTPDGGQTSPARRYTYDPALPISAAVPQIARLLAEHQVIVVAGATGSGKTTQLPKICLQAGRRRIGHTQPRRIAARSVAERIASELGEPLGETVGYQVRFSSKTSRQTQLKVMTDGIMLAEISHDRELRRYDTIIIDEAHERSLTIDFLLGYLKQLLPRRPDLRVIVTSATIDTARFAAHFGNAPVVEVEGRTYPVELRYRPVLDGAERDTDLIDAICGAVRELDAERQQGDILVFCSGEREIRDAADAIEALNLRFTEVMPLYARLSAAEQHRVFTPHTGRRIVLATNVAETSLTVPGIRYVIDPGNARISRYSARTKVQRLPIEPISQASANQRAGRCGRLGPGICIRLYSEEDYAGRPEFTEPEILRTNLASVILQMADARLGEITSFPFLEPPDASQVRDGIRLLRELGALAERQGHPGEDRVRLTAVGRKLARLPVDPRLGRMLVEAERQGCLREMLAIAAGLAIQDVRERPADAQQQADAAHRRFFAPLPSGDGDTIQATPDGSDIAALLRLWQYLRDQRRTLSGNAFRRLCRQEYLNFLRVREWQDLHTQLRQACDELGLHRNNEPAGLDRVHVAVLAGLLSHVGLLDVTAQPPTQQRTRRRTGPPEYLGARGSRFAINPGSSAARTKAPLVMAVELVETTRLWARTVAPIEAGWVEEVGAHLLKHSYSEPRWSARGGQCVATEKVTLLGIPIIAGRTVSYGSIDPVVAREVFIASALVEGDWRTRHHFWARNQAVRAEAAGVAERTRRLDLLADDQAIAAFYDARIPAGIVSVAHFDRWWRDARRSDEHLLDLSLDDLLTEPADTTGFPSQWQVEGHALDVDYTFDPGSGRDGVTVTVPLALLNQLGPEPFTWQVPGLRGEVATALLRGLPKQWRTQLVPAPDTARRALDWLGPCPDTAEPFWLALGRAIRALTGVAVPADAWQPEALDDHLRVRFEVARQGQQPVSGRDLPSLATQLGGQVSATLNRVAGHLVHPGATSWEFGALPARLDAPVVGFPALVDKVDRVGVQVFSDQASAVRSHRAGLRRLIALTTVDPTNWVVARLSNRVKLALATSPYPSVPALLVDARLKAIGDGMDAAGWAGVRDHEAFSRLSDTVRVSVAAAMQRTVDQAGEILIWYGDLIQRLAGLPEPLRTDVTEQVAGLVYPGFIAATPARHWPRLAVYLQAALRRIETRGSNPAREAEATATMTALEDDYGRLCSSFPPGPLPEPVDEIGWLLEELRVSLFAQSLGTTAPVSAKRVRAAMAALPAGS
ncbi:MAG: ATP-dependent RNA helicase HrpA [Propionicimonas sp.]|uniref:ATP-dependent RNA helicase HrpA n=1 Tax=Propionicimonas sp. TaxID=1955623 RepID=UPI002B1FA45C|nr:ATP-dependent RNA helicase HrpA [Propionicimonas sp.]MEA4943679.1 ATP-dependent RNA helicase HrpA [Propionicimonas sp.]